MQTQKIFLGFLMMLTIGVFSSCTKHNRPAELSFDAQTLEFDNTVLNQKFTITNTGDELLNVQVSSDQNWITVVGGDMSLYHAESSVVSVTVHPEYFQEYGTYTGSLYLNSNAGYYSIPVTVYYSQSATALLALDLDYLKFPSDGYQNYFTIYNDGGEAMNFSLQTNASWVQLSQSTGTIAANGEKRIDVSVSRTGLAAGVYSAAINITSTGGDATLNLDMDVMVYTITFFNPVYTPIEIQGAGFDPAVIDAGDRYSFVFTNNPQSFTYSASTEGETDNGSPLGVQIVWDETIDVSGDNSPTFNLNVSPDYFYMAVKNTGDHDLDMWSINNGNDYEINDDFTIPNDGVEYGVAYYDAFDDTDIYARLVGTVDDVVWSQGNEFTFPWTDNQYILLENNFKKSAIARTNLKVSSDQQHKVLPFKHAVAKQKGSIDLYNKK